MSLIEGTRRFINNEEIVVLKCYKCKELWEQFEIKDSKYDGSMWESCRNCRKPRLTIEEIKERKKEYSRRYRIKLKVNS